MLKQQREDIDACSSEIDGVRARLPQAAEGEPGGPGGKPGARRLMPRSGAP